MVAREQTQPVEGEVRPGHPAGRPARRQPPVRLRRAGGAEGRLPAHLPRPRRPLRHQHRRWTTGPSPASSWSRTISRSTATTCCAACSPICPPTIPRWTASPTWCPPPTGPSAKSATWSASSRSAIRYPKRLVLPDGWPEGVHPLRKDLPWNHVPEGFDDEREFKFDDPPEGCTVVPFGPFHPTLDEPAHFRLYVEGEMVRGCEYRGFMVHRGIEKLAESVLTYNDIPMMAERICGICGCVHNVAYAQAVETAAALQAPAARRIHPHDHAGDRAPAQPPALGRAGLPHRRLRHAVHAELPHPRADHVDGREDHRQPQDLRAVRHRRRALGHHARGEDRTAPGARQARSRVARGRGRGQQGQEHPEAHARRRRGRPDAGEERRPDRPGGARGGRGHRLPARPSLRRL